MLDRIRHTLTTLTPTQALIVGALFIGSALLAGLALWGFTVLNRKRQVT